MFSSNSLVVRWLGLGAFTAMIWVQSLVRKSRSYKVCGTAKKLKKRKMCVFRGNNIAWTVYFILWISQSTGEVVSKTMSDKIVNILQKSNYFQDHAFEFLKSCIICFWQCWGCIALRACLWLQRAGAAPQLRCAGFALQWLPVVEHRL